jgi:hypothetical protein
VKYIPSKLEIITRNLIKPKIPTRKGRLERMSVVQKCVDGYDPWMWVPVTTAWRVLRLRMEERPPIWRVAVNNLNKQPWTADEGWSSSLGVGRGANNPSP